MIRVNPCLSVAKLPRLLASSFFLYRIRPSVRSADKHFPWSLKSQTTVGSILRINLPPVFFRVARRSSVVEPTQIPRLLSIGATVAQYSHPAGNGLLSHWDKSIESLGHG